ncbi:ParA family protein [Serratia fonticola]|uniref:ParA family protein n=1 Tax=Serratia fonticola TaxID=47917 RepID=UPI001377366D|nr:AAA family ATPase [Serratia fonticola]NBJ34432.1 AAA family ATPase [Serratia fonticola]CAI1522942.1 Sporulation initiation inhibitor protein soj [Serratia fonticola]CAI1790558.1 Sporulation initiation inhibitor protein soj [Serratia fonticola]CAI1849482.1 Sporulation initiation inhibitor protein soj [Serratia fonticola]
MSAPVVSFINMKGGVGKTTLCVGIAEFLANHMGRKVLIIDIDPQFNATQSLMSKYNRVEEYIAVHLENKRTIRRIFETQSSIMAQVKTINKEDVITKIDTNLDIILGDINIIFDTSQEAVRIKKIKNFITDNKIRDEYDYILIDSPPTISLFTDAALVASDYYLVPVKIDHYSVLGATSLISVISNLQHNHNRDIAHLGFVYTNTDEDITQKTNRIKSQFETTAPFDSLYFFESRLTYVRDLMVGMQGNIPSCYTKSRADIESICAEFIGRVQQLESEKNG